MSYLDEHYPRYTLKTGFEYAWKVLLGAIVVALGSILFSIVLVAYSVFIYAPALLILTPFSVISNVAHGRHHKGHVKSLQHTPEPATQINAILTTLTAPYEGALSHMFGN